MSDTATELRWDPFDTEIDTEPYEIWRRLRDEAPLYSNDEYDFWALSRYADVEAAHLDPVTFCSGHGTVLEMMTPEPLRHRPVHLRRPTRAHPPAVARVACLHAAARHGARGADPRAVRRDARPAHGWRDVRLRAGLRCAAAVDGHLVAVRCASRGARGGPSPHRPGVPHRAGRRHDQRRVARTRRSGSTSTSRVSSSSAGGSRVDDMLTDLAHAEITDEDGTVRRLTDAQACDFANLAHQRGDRDGRPAARLRGGRARRAPRAACRARRRPRR